MPKVSVSQPSPEGPAPTYKKLRAYCEKKLVLKELGNLKPSVEWEEKNRQGSFKEVGVTGTIKVSQDSPCEITVVMDLPILMTPLKNVLTQAISDHLVKFTATQRS